MQNELLENEDILQKPAKGIITFIVSLVIIVLIFSLFAGGTPGSGGGTGGGDGTGNGTGIGSGTGSGEGSGNGNGIGESNTDGLGEGDEGVTNAEESGDGGAPVKENTSISNAGKKNPEVPQDKGIEENLKLPTRENWSPSAFKLGIKKGSGKPKPLPKAAGRGGGGGTKPMGTGDVSFRIYWEPKIHDVDLHVMDPNGHEIWYSSKNCPCEGELDVDDTKKGGPENIFWPKAKAPEGEYLYWVKYYQGVDPKNITIEIRRNGKLTKTRKIRLIKMGDESKRFSLIHKKK
jgi:hypothetical protein